MWFVDNLLSPIIKWTGPTLYKRQLTADQRILPIKELNTEMRKITFKLLKLIKKFKIENLRLHKS